MGNLKFIELVPLSQRPVVSSGPHEVLAAAVVVVLASSSVVVVPPVGGVRSTRWFGTAIFIIASSPTGLNSGIRGPRK